MFYKKFVGDLVYLSPVDSSYSSQLVQWLNDPNVSSGYGNLSIPVTEETEKQKMEYMAKAQNEYYFAIVRKSDDKFLGICSIYNLSMHNRNARFSYFIGDEENRGKGYGTDALRLLCDFAFNVVGMHLIYSSVYDFNIASIKAVQKVGGAICGEHHESIFYGGEFHNCYDVEILEKHFSEKYKSVVKKREGITGLWNKKD